MLFIFLVIMALVSATGIGNSSGLQSIGYSIVSATALICIVYVVTKED